MKSFENIPRYGNKLRVKKFECFYCQLPLNYKTITVDHLVPRSKGGIRSNDNKVSSCHQCNQLKANRTPDEFLEEIKKRLSEIEKNGDQETEEKKYLTKIYSRLMMLVHW